MALWLCPVYAGMNPKCSRTRSRLRSTLPRVRGDEPNFIGELDVGLAALPRVRGDEPTKIQYLSLEKLALPRVCGDEPEADLVRVGVGPFAPRMRG